ncbi:MAG: Crp/Fnr family transcriptional regulator [Bacteroidia bacterium]|nr:Crp/Fnr family transcriptional regulator [Bacteroidia bacterium]
MEIEVLNNFFSKRLSEELIKTGVIKEFNEGEVIIQEDKYPKAVPIILEGTIRVIRTEDDGNEILLYYLRPGDSCVMSMLDALHNDTSKVRGEIEEKAKILFIPVENISRFVRDFPEWLDYILSIYHKRFEELLEMVQSVAFKKVDERLLELLKKKSAVLKGEKSINVTHEQLARELGTSRVVVSRLLKEMERQNIVRLGRNNITLN